MKGYGKIMTENNNNVTYKCKDCANFIGGGDWNLCCKEHHEGYTFGFLCYEDTDACDKFRKKEETE